MADDIRLIIGVDDRDLIRSQKEQKKFERNILTIEQAYRKGSITASRYTSELNKQAKKLSLLGGTYKKANSEVRTYSATVRKLTDDQLRLTMAQNQAGKSTNRFGMYAQQVGYQVGDFFVQVQSGTSALVAFGQQGTQLAGLLPGVAGAVVGIGLSVGTMLLRSFMDASGSSKTFKEALEDTESSMEAYSEYAERAAKNTRELAESFGGFAGAMKGVLQDLQALERQEALTDFNQQIDNLALTTQSWRGTFVSALNGTAEGVKLLSKELGLTVTEFVALNEESQKTKSGAIEDRVAAAISLRDSILEVTGGTDNMTKKMRAYYSNLLLSVTAGGELTATLDGSGESAEKINVAEKERLKLQGENFRARRKEVQSVRASQISSHKTQKASLELAQTQLRLEVNYKDTLYIENQMQRHKILLQVQNKDLTVEQGKELIKLTDQLTLQKGQLDEINDKEAARLALIKLQTDLEISRGRKVDVASGGNLDFSDPRNETGTTGVVKRDRANPQGKKTNTGKGGKSKTPREKLAEYLEGKRQELELEGRLVGIFGAERDIKSELFEVEEKYGKLIDTTQDSQLAGTLRQIEAEKERHAVMEEAKAQQEALADTIASSMETAMMSMVDGTKTVKEAFKDMARDIIKHLYKVLVIQQAINALGGIMSGSSNPVIKTLGGGLESYASADGGGYTGDAPRSGGLDGKGGFMMMMHPRETVVDHTKANSGGGGQNVVINQSFNFAANGDDSVKKLIAQAAPQIAQMTKSSLLNDRRRGGATKAAFG